MDRTAREIIAPGVVAGWGAGLAALMLAMIHAALAGRGLLWPLQVIASALLGDQALEGRGLAAAGSAITGLVIHLLVSGSWGVLFNALVPRGFSYGWAAGMGMLFAVVAFLVMAWLVVPWFLPELYRSVHPAVLLVYHLVFGALIPLALPLRRGITEADERALRRAHV